MAKATVQYRQVNPDLVPNEFSLKSEIIRWLNVKNQDGTTLGQSAKYRKIDLDQDGSLVILNTITQLNQWEEVIFYGELFQTQQGAEIAAVNQSLDDDTNAFLLENIHVGENTKVIKGVLYFVVIGNHVGLIEDHQVRGKTLERFLTRIIKDNSGIEEDHRIVLNCEIIATDGSRVENAKVVEIKAKKNQPRLETPYSDDVTRTETDQARDDRTVFDVLRVLGWTPESIAQIEAEIPPTGWIEGKFKFNIKDKNKIVSMPRVTLNEALRNIDDEDIGLKGDGKESNGFLKLSEQCDIRTVGALKLPSDAIQKIIYYLRQWAEQGKIDCHFN